MPVDYNTVNKNIPPKEDSRKFQIERKSANAHFPGHQVLIFDPLRYVFIGILIARKGFITEKLCPLAQKM